MKPGSKDRPYKILITGQELIELKKVAESICEAFGLERRIAKYKGKRPIGFYRWDMDGLEDAIGFALEDPEEYPDKAGPEYEALANLYERIKKISARAYAEMGTK
jgi:hypothetical protein